MSRANQLHTICVKTIRTPLIGLSSATDSDRPGIMVLTDDH